MLLACISGSLSGRSRGQRKSGARRGPRDAAPARPKSATSPRGRGLTSGLDRGACAGKSSLASRRGQDKCLFVYEGATDTVQFAIFVKMQHDKVV